MDRVGWAKGVLVVAVLGSTHAYASAGGMLGYTGQPRASSPGALCSSCHLGGAAPKLTLEGPESAPAGSTLRFTLILQGSAAKVGGFAISTDTPGAALVPEEGERGGPEELTHRAPVPFEGGRLSFRFGLTLPSTEGEVALFAVGNACNGDGVPGGDASGGLRVKVLATAPVVGPVTGEQGFVGYTGVGCTAVAGTPWAALALLLCVRRRRAD